MAMYPVRNSVFPAIAALAAAILLIAALPALAIDFPALTGRVVDNADLLSPATETMLTEQLQAVEDKTTDQVVVVTLPSLEGNTIEDFGYQLGRHWGIGQAGKDNGILLIVAPNERKVRIEVGYGLEGTLPDAVSKLIIETSILPRFKSGDMEGGIVSGATDIIRILMGDAEAYQQRALDYGQNNDTAIVIFIVAFIFIVAIIIIISVIAGGGGGTGSGRRRSSSSWSSGSSGWSGGGGFSGGGGSFGGGGSSGSW